jgi:hypothetical protein
MKLRECLGCLLLAGGFLWADRPQWVPFTSAVPAPAEWRMVEDTPDRMVVALRLPGYFIEDVDVGGTPYTLITLPGAPQMQEKNAPALPYLRANLIIPDTARMELKNVRVETRELSINHYLPSKGALYHSVRVRRRL